MSKKEHVSTMGMRGRETRIREVSLCFYLDGALANQPNSEGANTTSECQCYIYRELALTHITA